MIFYMRLEAAQFVGLLPEFAIGTLTANTGPHTGRYSGIWMSDPRGTRAVS